MKKISFVVPVFNEEENIHEFYRRLTQVMAPLPYDYEILFIDDGSKDRTSQLIRELAEKDPNVQGYVFARNFGHQLALTCGLDQSTGDAVISMDGDLQHPPEMVPELLKKWEEGFEIVQTVRKATEDATWFKNITSRLYYKLINSMSEVRITPGGSDFRLMDRKAVDALNRFRERARFIRGMVNNLGFRYTTLEFVAPPRFAGHSKFNLRKMLRFALDGITAFSRVPLRLALYVGCIAGLGSILLIGHVIYVKYIIQDAVPGWTTLAAAEFFLGGVELIGIGIVGEYVGRIFDEVKQRPLYIIREHIVKSGNSQ
ncbi:MULTISPECIES: glycosyltransferase family 2 protein [Acidaminococcus]|jgi:glycosyltransferase involved in cell wall biosynthesis|uniref:Glycosyltransferase family 2 protein n=1 Tax=Acidaminococcus fermentans TaxID=905 RepID=A0A6N7W3X9_ACIFE|nr:MULTISPECIES: glycosyltransferase family 2 protein [Acidaminococcus]MEE1598922.1 glycosyltransferase family 2 protein [Acidaminococcus fermentans]MEE4123184.1 glycosyltransferase family 2 protein [Acidaminococcus fermentans]MSS82838.1 glycosyltransferase family 2 protein [Acidaminococcus fermentans]CDE94129.1 glycosyl transferase family 2 [Acidaminococcus sp. CAG:542]